jgi:mono/diheme cytochrome c family protein
MAATDQTYRNQKALDIVFAVSSILLLVSIIWMFVQDYNREWKTEQRRFRDVETAMFTRQAIADMPDPATYRKAQKDLDTARKALKETITITIGGEKKSLTRADAIKELDAEIRRLLPDKERGEAKVGDIKSLVASRISFLNIAEEHRDDAAVKEYRKEVEDLEKRFATAQGELDEVMAKIKDRQQQKDQLEKPANEAETRLKRLTDDFVRRVRAAVKSQWGFGDWFRSLPIIDGFASPTKIHQFTLNELGIDYNFKYVTRFDRCLTCHLGLDRPAYTESALTGLRAVPPDLDAKLKETQKILGELRERLGDTIPDPDYLRLTALSKNDLTDSRIKEFAAHPRLDLYVGSNSKHPGEKFGCTICHSGQGSATDFYWATHTPDNPEQAKKWKEKHDWGAVHFWDFPMFPKRFTESSCLKCHHQVTDLITSYNYHEAPKLLRGYNLIREYGCFGCHEINGTKDGNPVGPDLRLEPYPAPELLPPADRERLLSDKTNPPGTLRKVGPSLFRLSEKTNREWVERWIKSPRTFRPDTKMPHFYGLSNNNHQALKGTGQENFPDAEVASITHYLLEESRAYLAKVKQLHEDPNRAEQEARDEQIIEDVIAKLANRAALADMTNEQKDKLKKELEDAKIRIALRKVNPPIHQGKPPAPPKGLEALYRGRKLFTERGCLACHNHHGTTEPMKLAVKEKAKEKGKEKEIPLELPAVHSEAHFGPTLSQIKAKLGTKPGDMASARTWLIHWITNPWMHSPRTRMPITHLDEKEAADVAEWLLSQPATELGPGWRELTVSPPEDRTLQALVKVYLERIIPRREMDVFFIASKTPFARKGKLTSRGKELPADEQSLADRLARATDPQERQAQTMWYLGRKAVGRMGCFGCHDIPGFETTKPIGTTLNGWGKKDPGRLAFEDIKNYLKDHYKPVEQWKDPAKVAAVIRDKKEPYEGFFWDELMAHNPTRAGYLHQKIKDPRSYDYKRRLAWDDRGRMPQFKFAHPKPRGQEDEQEYAARQAWAKATGQPADKRHKAEGTVDFEARAAQEEAEAREAVMTFVLGLTDESIPLQYLPQPSPDRLAEYRGRQVLDKFNCAGCHAIRPGEFEFRLGADALESLQNSASQQANVQNKTDFDFKDHYVWNHWSGRPPTSTKEAKAYGVFPQLRPTFAIEKKKVPVLTVQLTEAVPYKGGFKLTDEAVSAARYDGLPAATAKKLKSLKDQDFITRKDLRTQLAEILSPKERKQFGELLEKHAQYFNGPMKNLRGSFRLNIPSDALVRPGPEALVSPQTFHRYLEEHGPFGGRFTDLLVKYLIEWGELEKEAGKVSQSPYPDEGGMDNGKARASAPPPLFNQGERTQPDWLFRFLRDPPRIRRLTVLRMPRFNLSDDDARALVNYFTAVDRINNPSIGLTTPFVGIPQRGELTDHFWKDRTRHYVKDLKDTKDPANPKQSLYDSMVKELTPVWEEVVKEQKTQAKDAATRLKEAQKKLEELKASEKNAKEGEKQALAKSVEDAQKQVTFWSEESDRLSQAAENASVEGLRTEYRTKEAYAHAGFRVLAKLCASCHEVGALKPSPTQLQGPPLTISHERLRPEWLKRWIAFPQRYLPYASSMPQNFPSNAPLQYPNWIAGTPLEQVIGVRDALMNFPQVDALPINRYWLRSGGTGEKK